jgi:aspartate aminotransferase-like enzyme
LELEIVSVNFRLPGPTPLPPAVLEAMQRPMIPHRGSSFQALYSSILRRLRVAHRTDGDVFVWPASGSAGWEAAIVNLLSPGDPVLSVTTGDFGDRFARVAAAFGLDVRLLEIPWGQAATPDQIRAALEQNPEVKAVFLTHNETSTAVTNPLATSAAVVREHGALVVVDAVSSVAGLPLLTDDWGLDFVLSGSQKAWMCPPGLMIAAAGPRAFAASERSTFPRFFWDIGSARTFAMQGMTLTTPPLTMLYALDAALDMILDEGLEQVWARHARLGEQMRAGIDRIGMTLFADRAYPSNTVTAVALPETVSAKTVLAEMRARHNIELQGGQGRMSDRMVRIGHMGWVDAAELEEVTFGLDDIAERLEIERAPLLSRAHA